MPVKDSTAHNSTFGRELAITVMDEIRAQYSTGKEVTIRTLTNAIESRSGVERRALLERVTNCINGLKRAGHITTERKPNGDKIPYQAITPTKP